MEQNLKQRVVGALVIISMAVIFLPLVFDGQQRKIDTSQYAIPEKPALTIVAPEIEPLEQAARDQYQDVAVVEQEKAQQDETSVPVDAMPDTTTPVASAPAAKAPTQAQVQAYLEQEKKADAALENKPVTTPVALADAWMIQVGAFSSDSNAKAMQSRMKEAGYPAFVKRSGALYKVYVGPENRQPQAEQTKIQLERKFGIKALILKYIP